jgi:hypothetical protein
MVVKSDTNIHALFFLLELLGSFLLFLLRGVETSSS